MSVVAAFDAVVGVAHSAIESLAAVSTPALAIILFTVAVRLLISPLTYLQVRGERRRAALAPQMKELQDKHKDDPLTLATEMLALQRSAGAGPMTSLLPGLAQAPFFMVMFAVVNQSLIGGALLGVPLTAHLFAGLPVFAALLVLALALAWWSSRRMPADTPRWVTFLPYLTVPMVAYLPLAGGLYLVTSTAWTALERAVWRPVMNR
jgi:YidC/Oxa1 family membrane protein insertase